VSELGMQRANCRGAMGNSRMFFFEKKNQKTFIHEGAAPMPQG
jgi:hypothetical protein